MGTLKNKRSNMNNDAAKNANNQLITVKNEATPDAAFLPPPSLPPLPLKPISYHRG